MILKKVKKLLIYSISTILALSIITLSVYLIQREIKWKETRKEMDIMEQEILQKIIITDDEKLPIDMIEALFSSIMAEETKENGQNTPAFERLTQEFLIRINKQMGLSLTQENLKYYSYIDKSFFDKYGTDINIAYYQFIIGEETYHYNYYINGKVRKTIDKGIRQLNFVILSNEDNENIYGFNNDWKNGVVFINKVSMDYYHEFMMLWNMGVLPEGMYITIENIKNVYFYKNNINKTKQKLFY